MNERLPDHAAETEGAIDRLGTIVARHRSERRWSQQRLAERAGLARRTVTRAETGAPLSASTRMALEKALDTTLPGGRPEDAPILPRARAVGRLLRRIRLEITPDMFPQVERHRHITLAIAAASLRISPSRLSRLERGLAAPKMLFEVEPLNGDVYLLNRGVWQSIFYMRHLDAISDLATADGRKGRFRN